MLFLLKTLAIWACFIPIAILNGGLRERCLLPLLGRPLAQPLSGLTGSALFFLFSWFTLPWLGPLPPRHALALGACWLLLTVLFEFTFGRLVMKKSWQALFASYNPLSGDLWLLVLVVIAVSPWFVARLRGW